MVDISDIHKKINKLVISKFPQIKSINLTLEHRDPSFSIKKDSYYDGVLVFDVEIFEDTKFIPKGLWEIGNTIFLIMKMLELDNSNGIKVNFNSLVGQSSFINY